MMTFFSFVKKVFNSNSNNLGWYKESIKKAEIVSNGDIIIKFNVKYVLYYYKIGVAETRMIWIFMYGIYGFVINIKSILI